MKSEPKSSLLDIAGIWTSGLCAVHCLFLPMLLSVSTFSGLTFLDHPYLENAILVISCILGMFSLIPSYVKHHRSFSPMMMLAAGFALIAMGKFVPSLPEHLFTSAGAVLVALAHLRNVRLSQKCNEL
jgi:hypothetical protein